jgi:RimJ/RimL family protein N-acetyltransferase
VAAHGADGRPLGAQGLRQLGARGDRHRAGRGPRRPDLEVGWLVDREHWGKGYAPEAALASAKWAHEQLGKDHIISVIHPSNARSIRVAEKLGETPEGHFSAFGFDLLVYGSDLPLDSAA